MQEGTVPFPPYLPCAESDDDVAPVQEVSHFLGSTKRLHETRVERSGFLNISLNRYFLFRIGEPECSFWHQNLKPCTFSRLSVFPDRHPGNAKDIP